MKRTVSFVTIAAVLLLSLTFVGCGVAGKTFVFESAVVNPEAGEDCDADGLEIVRTGAEAFNKHVSYTFEKDGTVIKTDTNTEYAGTYTEENGKVLVTIDGYTTTFTYEKNKLSLGEEVIVTFAKVKP